jgi:hypothetical protein
MSKITKISPPKNTELKQPSVPGGPLVFENSQRTSRFHERPSKRTSSLGLSSLIRFLKLLEPPYRLKTGSMTAENRQSIKGKNLFFENYQ